jgi:TonB family protein
LYSSLQHTDSGSLRFDYFVAGTKPQMKALFEDSACKIYNGQSVFLYANGLVESVGKQIHNKREGICLSFHSNGMIADSTEYHNDRPIGNHYRWYRNGGIQDSVAHLNDSMDVSVSWFDDGVPAAAGYLLYGNMHGKWQFFRANEKLASAELYDHGKLVSISCYNEDGSAQTDTSKANADASFKGGPGAWQAYLNKNLYWPPNYAFSQGNMATVGVDITINENGKPENVEVSIPFHPAFDKIALDVVRRSPAWKPSICHNRKVKTVFRQPVTFREEE